jgi:hypothetical protein
MRVCANLPLPGRDLRLDLSRGLANWAIFLDHIPHEVMNSITTRNYGFSDAADLFVFISGYTAACVFGRMMIEQGYVAAAWGLFKRTAKLYAAHMACTSAADQVRSEFASGVLYRHRSCVLCPRCHRAKPEFSLGSNLRWRHRYTVHDCKRIHVVQTATSRTSFANPNTSYVSRHEVSRGKLNAR